MSLLTSYVLSTACFTVATSVEILLTSYVLITAYLTVATSVDLDHHVQSDEKCTVRYSTYTFL